MPYQPVALDRDHGCAARPRSGGAAAAPPSRRGPTRPPSRWTACASTGAPARAAGHQRRRRPGHRAAARRATARSRSSPTRTAPPSPVDGAPVLTRDGDVRPDVAGAFTDAAGRRRAACSTADTRFQTTISPLKAALAAVGRARAARDARRAAPGRPRRDRAASGCCRRGWWRPARRSTPRSTALLGVWWVDRRGHRRRRLHRRHRPQPRRATASSATSTAGSTPPRRRSAGSTTVYYPWSLVSAVDAVDAAAVHPARAAVLVAAVPARCCPGWAGSPRGRSVAVARRAGVRAPGGCRSTWGCGPSRGSRSARWRCSSPSSGRWPPARVLPLAVGLAARRGHHGASRRAG